MTLHESCENFMFRFCVYGELDSKRCKEKMCQVYIEKVLKDQNVATVIPQSLSSFNPLQPGVAYL